MENGVWLEKRAEWLESVDIGWKEMVGGLKVMWSGRKKVETGWKKDVGWKVRRNGWKCVDIGRKERVTGWKRDETGW